MPPTSVCEAVRVIDRGDLGRARHLLGEMATELAAHWQGEETGLFRVMAREEMFAEHIAPPIRQLHELGELLATASKSPPSSAGSPSPVTPADRPTT